MGLRGRTKPLALQSGKVGAWLRVADARDAGTFKLPDLLDAANPATQSTAARKPTIGTAANGLPILTFVDDVLVLPLTSGSNNPVRMGIACWIRLANVVGNKTIATISSTAGGASANKLLYMANAETIRCDDQTVDRHAVSSTLSAATWHFATMEINCARSTEATQVIHTLDLVAQSVTFSSGTPWSTTLGTPTGNMLIGANTTGGGTPLVGDYGPNIWLLLDQLTAAERSSLRNIDVPT